MKRQLLLILSIILALPLLVSLDPLTTSSNYYAHYRSPEGIQFLSYSSEWDKDKLQELYEELLKNKHGEEIKLLQEVKVVGDGLGEYPHDDYYTKGIYHALTSSITLFHGNKYTEPHLYRETLAHEYGHHFTYHYFPEHHFPFSKWSKLRGLDQNNVRWDAFWNYSLDSYSLFPQEIIADDYLLLYGATSKVDFKDVLSHEAFYTMTMHDNQQIPNVLENSEVQSYFEEKTGFLIDKHRLLNTPILEELNQNTLTFKVLDRSDVAYRLNVKLYKVNSLIADERLIAITPEDFDGEIQFALSDLYRADFIDANFSILDLNTSIGFETDTFTLKLD
ncbi:hypothetical protein IMZ08_17290 [Bacillus luteolus]|uniref:Peptidase MA-like domain-containing protein n=1 Tax=Litchfieldia luteola TaxID=682179 RepID=A0ABR9QMQ7_9BACI|nr:hypothetical protein [Cytobacillus luteolus]MBE4909791.1 hypothetical protein [Cytobacillus luteolus]MBP1942666.1 hypothetical protein [Cytobacillus luteolus]